MTNFQNEICNSLRNHSQNANKNDNTTFVNNI